MLVHLLFWGAAVAMVLLGAWQLRVARADGFPLQNTSYVVQWWLFAACAMGFWVRVVWDALRRTQPAARSTGGELVRSGHTDLTRPGAALLRVRDQDGGSIAYRGYRLPDSSRSVAPSHGDRVHDAYNDYLWQLAVADGATPPVTAPAISDPAATGRELAAPHADGGVPGDLAEP